MGQKNYDRIFVNTKKFAKQEKLNCYNEMMEAIDCLKDANFEHTKCARYLTAMMDCYTTQGKKSLGVNTVNFHLQRLVKRR